MTRVPQVTELNRLSISPPLVFSKWNRSKSNNTPGFEMPTWDELVASRRPPPRNTEDEPGTHGSGWPHEAAALLEWNFRERMMVTPTESELALLRSENGTAAVTAFTVAPSHSLVRIESQLFRVLLLRRSRLPLPLSSRKWRCGRLLDSFGHHRASCAQTGVLGRRGYALESAAARNCREAGDRVATNVLARDLHLPAPPNDGRRLDVVVDGLPVYGGAPLAGYGSALRGAAARDGVALAEARRRKERTHPEFVQPGRRANLVVVAGEVGWRWSDEAIAFIRHLAKARARGEPVIPGLCGLLACATARAFAWNVDLLEVQTVTRQMSTTCSTIADSLGWSWLREPAATLG